RRARAPRHPHARGGPRVDPRRRLLRRARARAPRARDGDPAAAPRARARGRRRDAPRAPAPAHAHVRAHALRSTGRLRGGVRSARHGLAARADESVHLSQRGLVARVVMSGAVEPENGLSEPEVMRARAVAAGVPEEAILLDSAGVDTAATVRNTAALMRREGLG